MTVLECTSGHEQVPIKVNAFVDKGIAPVVVAMNEIDGVVTLDSCEGAGFGNARWAVVDFVYGRDWHELAELVQVLAAVIREIDLGEAFSVRLEWLGSNDQPRAQLMLSPGRVAEVAAAIRTALPLTRRRSRSVRGNAGTAPRSSTALHSVLAPSED